MTSHGKSYGAVSVINAIPCGIGATMGISLETNVTYSEGGEGRDIEIVGAKNMSKAMARICVKKTLERIRADRSIPYSLTIDSQIPPSRGLKSSSSVCNAIISALSIIPSPPRPFPRCPPTIPACIVPVTASEVNNTLLPYALSLISR